MEREIYFAECSGRIKVGISRFVDARLAQLRQGSGGRVTLIASVAGNFALERAMHKKLRPYRLDREWYRDCAEVRAAIQNALNNFPVPTARETHQRGAERFKAVCKVLWPERTAEALAEIAGTDKRSGARWLSGESEPPGVVLAAVLVEITRRS